MPSSASGAPTDPEGRVEQASGLQSSRRSRLPTAAGRGPQMRQQEARTSGSRFRYVPRGAYPVAAVSAPTVDLDLDVFAGPFDLLLAVLLREEVSLLEVELSEVVLAYIEHLEQQGELDLEVATEFLVLIASLLELKSRLMLPSAEEELGDVGPEEAVEELLARI